MVTRAPEGSGRDRGTNTESGSFAIKAAKTKQKTKKKKQGGNWREPRRSKPAVLERRQSDLPSHKKRKFWKSL